MVRAVSGVKKVKVKKVKVAKVKKAKIVKLKVVKGKRGQPAVQPVAPPPPAPVAVTPPPSPLPTFSLPDQITRLGNAANFNVSQYLQYYESVNGKRQLLQAAVQNRGSFNSLTPEQQAFLNKYGGPNSSTWLANANLLINQEIRPFDFAERQRLNIPVNVPLNNALYQQALTKYNSIADKSLIGTLLDKVQNFSSALTNLIRSFGAAASGVIKQLTDGLQNALSAFFPSQLHTMDIQQGYVGNCYLLAGINALGEKGDASTQNMLRDAVTFNDDGSINVSFAGYGVKDWDARGNPVYTNYTVQPNALKWFEQNDRFSRGNTPLGVRAIEVAYGMHRAGLSRLDNPGQMNQAQQALWSGTLDEGITALTGLQSQYFNSAGMSPSQFSAAFNNPKAQAITAGTSPNPQSPLVPSHAYTITAYDAASNLVTVENPWYTGQPFQISASAFSYYAVTAKP